MSYSLSCYLVASSHNTYLEGNQLNSFSSSDMYARVLKTGCRCVECKSTATTSLPSGAFLNLPPSHSLKLIPGMVPMANP